MQLFSVSFGCCSPHMFKLWQTDETIVQIICRKKRQNCARVKFAPKHCTYTYSLLLPQSNNFELHIVHVNFQHSFPIHISMDMSDTEIIYMELCIGRLHGKLTWSICPLNPWSNRKSQSMSPRYDHVILVSRYLILTGVNWSKYGCPISKRYT